MENDRIIKLKISDLKQFKYNKLIWTKDRLDVRDEILNTGFDYKKGFINITKDNYITDGNHRFQTLKEMYGENYQVYVERISLTKKQFMFFILTFGIIFFPFVLIKFLKDKYEFRKNSRRNKRDTEQKEE
jgi:hypothetical protein